MVSRKIAEKDFKKLYSLSAGRCNVCGCELFSETFHLGEMGHIIPFSNNSNAPRADYKLINNYSTSNSYDNLILLCANCHIKVDSDVGYYTVEKLLEIKKNFESEISSKLAIQFSNNSDGFLLKSIHDNYDLQSLLAQLNHYCSINNIPLNITDIGDIEEFILETYRPTHYPFHDDELNRIMNKILENYYVFRKITLPKYTLNHSGSLSVMENHRLLANEEADLENALSNLTKYLYEWLKYCRENNYL